MDFSVGTAVWCYSGDGRWWPGIVCQPDGELTSETARQIYFVGDGSGAEADVSQLLLFSTEDPEKMDNPTTAAAVAQMLAWQENAQEDAPDMDEGVDDVPQKKSKAERKEERKKEKKEKKKKAARREQRKGGDDSSDSDDDGMPAADEAAVDDGDVVFEQPDREHPDGPDFQQHGGPQRLHELRAPRAPCASSRGGPALGALDVASTAPCTEVRSSITALKRRYAAGCEDKEMLYAIQPSDFIRETDQKIVLLKVFKQSLLKLCKANEVLEARDTKQKARKEDDLQILKADIAVIDETIVHLTTVKQPAITLKPNEKPDTKKAKTNAFSAGPSAQWHTELPFVAVDPAMQDLSRAAVARTSTRHRAPKVTIMKTWSTIRDKPTFARVRDTQPVLTEGALSRRFDSISKQSTMDLMRRANASKRHPLDLSAYDSAMELHGEQPGNAYFHFGDFARVADDVAAVASQSAPLEDILTPAAIMSAMPALDDDDEQVPRGDELPEDVLPEPERGVGNLPSPSAPWVTSESDAESSRADVPDRVARPAPQAPPRSSAKSWPDYAKAFIKREMSLYYHGKGGKEKLVSNDEEFAMLGKKILTRVVTKKDCRLRNVAVEFTENDEKKIMKEIDKTLHEAARAKGSGAERKRLRAPDGL
jgi:hypothetical protein